jgi:hypothetical protein
VCADGLLCDGERCAAPDLLGTPSACLPAFCPLGHCAFDGGAHCAP